MDVKQRINRNKIIGGVLPSWSTTQQELQINAPQKIVPVDGDEGGAAAAFKHQRFSLLLKRKK